MRGYAGQRPTLLQEPRGTVLNCRELTEWLFTSDSKSEKRTFSSTPGRCQRKFLLVMWARESVICAHRQKTV